MAQKEWKVFEKNVIKSYKSEFDGNNLWRE